MRKMCVLLLAALFLLTCDFARSQTVRVPSKWVGGPVILSAGEKGSFDDVAVKDPTIVYYQGKWHLFYTVSGKEPGGIGYVSAESLDLLKKSGENVEAVITSEPSAEPAYLMGLSSPTVMTIRVRKVDVDAFYKGEIDFDTFRRKVAIFAY